MDAASAPSPPASREAEDQEPRTGAATILTALGIVYGDLGTSPLYTYQTIVGTVGGHPGAAEAIGLLSLVVWSLIVIVSVKYCLLVMNADNHGEGGIMALMALVTARRRRGTVILTLMGLFGAALLYGDGVITPAISVLSALEGLNVATGVVKPYILPASLAVLLVLFAAQARGTAAIGRIFGPVMLVWFLVIGALGAIAVAQHPRVLLALDPRAAIDFLRAHGLRSLPVLGGVFLAVTGGEALYADMGGVGRGPIRAGWYGLVLPALLLCYAGQTALLVADPRLAGNPFFRLPPSWAVIPMVALATAATVIASQAIITGVFSLTRQAIQLGWLPGLFIRQTSDRQYGQIYVGSVNWIMMIITIVIAYGFGSSDKLASAFGTAVSTTMLLTTALMYSTMRQVWRWPVLAALAAALPLLAIDLAFFAANLLKVREGGWVPLLLAALMLTIMLTWHRGIAALRARLPETPETPQAFLARLRTTRIARVPGTAIFLSRAAQIITPVLIRHVENMKALQQTAISLTVIFESIPRVRHEDRVAIEDLGEGLWHVTVRFGFVEVPNIPGALAQARDRGCPVHTDDVVYFASADEVVRAPARPRLPAWQRFLFSVMYRNAVKAPDRFDIPADKLLEIGRQVAL